MTPSPQQRRRNGFKSEGALFVRREARENFYKSAPSLLVCAPLAGWAQTGTCLLGLQYQYTIVVHLLWSYAVVVVQLGNSNDIFESYNYFRQP